MFCLASSGRTRTLAVFVFTTFTSKRVTTFSAPSWCVFQNKPSFNSFCAVERLPRARVSRTNPRSTQFDDSSKSILRGTFSPRSRSEQSLPPVDDGKLAVGMWAENVDAAMFLTCVVSAVKASCTTQQRRENPMAVSWTSGRIGSNSTVFSVAQLGLTVSIEVVFRGHRQPRRHFFAQRIETPLHGDLALRLLWKMLILPVVDGECLENYFVP